MWEGFHGNVFPISRLTEFFQEAILDQEVELVSEKRCEYFNIPASFDIETTSWTDGKYEDGRDVHLATMYIWQFGLNGSVIYGRTWDEFGTLLQFLHENLGLSENRHLVIYVHNLGYEFQFMRKYFDWDKVFAIKTRRPVYAISGGFEFRCSLFLSNYALEYIGDNLLMKYPVQKLVGNLDYSKKRHSYTPLTKAELAYCVNDVRVVMSYIQEKIEQDGDITKIPLTNTGYVRNYCREECFYEDCEDEEDKKKVRKSYSAIMKSLQVQTEEEYDQMKRAFMGGFTHASALYSGQIMYNVGSADLTSSYPFTMVGQYFPMTRGEYIGNVSDRGLLRHYLEKFCCLFDIEFVDLKPRVDFENILSESRCWEAKEGDRRSWKMNNGRIVSAPRLRTTLTELDFENVSRFYTWSSFKVSNLRIYRRGYLPKALILAVLDLYENKTKLKGIAGKEVEYLVSKNMINAAFGMMVTAIIRDEFYYDTSKGWAKFEADVVSQLTKYNSNFNRFLYYGWGVWVTAHARHNLFSAIYEFGADYIYSDTDSVKGINFSDHMQYFKEYNNSVFDKLLRMCTHYNIPFNKVRPKTRKGEEKMIGVWDIEAGYKKFKTVGAKRYIYENQDGTLGLTVSGLNKKFAIPYLLWKYGGGDSPENERLCLDWLLENDDAFINDNSVFEKDDSYFIRLARIAYSGKDEDIVKDAKEFIKSLHLSYLPIFGYFGDGLYVPAGHTGKMTLDYIDNPTRAILIDYLRTPAIVEEQSSVYMEPQSYLMSQTTDYLKFLSGIQEIYY